MMTDMFKKPLRDVDHDIFKAIENEYHRQKDQLELIASENIVSQAVMDAQGSVLTNKYAEGYPGKRYYGGCEFVDSVEDIARERLKKLFGVKYANVQPHSGSQANQAVFNTVLKPGDTIMGLSLDEGGHLTHGASVNQSGKFYHAVFYGLDPKTEEIDYAKALEIAKVEKPKLIIAGASAYSREIDFKKFREIADEVGAYLLVDMAHIAGLIAAGAHPSPFPHAHFVTSTTHKTLRGPRGGIILTNDADLAKRINSAVFPGMQGGPLMHVIAAKAVAFGEVLEPEFKIYIDQVVQNARVLAKTLSGRGLKIISGGTDNHLLLLDLREWEITGKDAEVALEEAGMTCNKNAMPGDTQPPQITSGIRLGTAAITTRGLRESDCEKLGNWIADVLEAMRDGKDIKENIRAEVKAMCARFPIYEYDEA